MTNYEEDTLNGYLTKKRVAEYKNYHTKSLSWGRLVTWMEQRVLKSFFDQGAWQKADSVLDIPCGTGILGQALFNFPGVVVASDISNEMLNLARDEYAKLQEVKFVKADIVDTLFDENAFACVVTLGFLHRVPPNIKEATLKEIFRLSNRYAVISFSKSSFFQHSKHFFFKLIKPDHIPASNPMTITEAKRLCESVGFSTVRVKAVLPFFSSHTILILKK